MTGLAYGFGTLFEMSISPRLIVVTNMRFWSGCFSSLNLLGYACTSSPSAIRPFLPSLQLSALFRLAAVLSTQRSGRSGSRHMLPKAWRRRYDPAPPS